MLSEKARDALMYAYGDEYCLQPDEFGDSGVHPATIRALLRKGFVEPEDEDDFWCDYTITKAGKDALGITAALKRPPKRIKTAILRAVALFLEDTPGLKSSVYPPSQLNAVIWYNDEQQADYSDALMVLDLDGADMRGFDDHWWTCVGQLVRDLGFEVYADVGRLIVAFWAEEQ
jgi:hypothetical protein